jgi:hypothetical protein
MDARSFNQIYKSLLLLCPESWTDDQIREEARRVYDAQGIPLAQRNYWTEADEVSGEGGS